MKFAISFGGTCVVTADIKSNVDSDLSRFTTDEYTKMMLLCVSETNEDTFHIGRFLKSA